MCPKVHVASFQQGSFEMMHEAWAVAKIFLVCILSAMAYGIVHDQVTARVCVEYFTIGHPKIIASDSPTWLGVAWGITATWWVGFILAWPLAIAARWGKRPPLGARDLRRPVVYLLVAMALLATFAGFVGRGMAENGHVVLTEPLASQVPADRHVAFIATAFAHSTSYLAGFFGGIGVIFNVWWKRRLRAAGLDASFK